MRARHSPPHRASPTTSGDVIAHAPNDAGHASTDASVVSAVASQLAAQRVLSRAVRARATRRIELDAAEIDARCEAPLGIVPFQERGIAPLPADTRSRFLARLTVRLDEAFAATGVAPVQSEEDEASSPHEAILATGCAMCRGACCTRGADHAFLGVDSLLRVRAEHPGQSAVTLLGFYVAHLPVNHFADSCVYHAEFGCSLPRALRSNTCNRYRCGGLTQLRRGLAESNGAQAFIGVSDSRDLRDLAWVGPNEMRRIALTDAPLD